MSSLPTFRDFFKALWGYGPFPWQVMLSDRIAHGGWPAALDLPTASGKTACMDVAIWTLAQQASCPVSKRAAPRRIWFVVDRRIVVDEAYERATRIAEKLENASDGPLAAIARRLRQVSGTDRPLGVARLRGGILHDDGWGRLPSQPAVITSTVDQLGSRLLFRGYGRSHLTAPIFAGLAAHDSLILLDEAHCSVPFVQTVRAVERFRGESWAEEPIRTPFAFAILSATPPPHIPESAEFPGGDRGKALDHPVLRARTKASKTAELILLKVNKGTLGDPLVNEAVERAKCYINEHGKRRVAVILNRVRTAADIATMLRADLGGSADVVLLTGRLRPFERDRLVGMWKPYLRANEPEEPERPIALVSTQCIEVGADFSFDALVTEAASLDALRQRFGRLNRFGASGASPAAVLIRLEEAKGDTTDPIYGSSIAACWGFLGKHATSGAKKNSPKIIDFGIESMEALLADLDDLSPYLAPTPNAPKLLPAHIDLLSQTSPVPRPDPDIQAFLHGIGRGAPEARVVWRADLYSERTDTWLETVALCAPTSGEVLSVPLFRLRQWLAQSEDEDSAGDVEGAAHVEESGSEAMRPALLWAGREHSRLVTRTTAVKPNDLVVVPADYGMIPSGQSEPDAALGQAKLDLWEPVRATAGRRQALRLHRGVLEPWLGCPPLRDLVALATSSVVEREDLWAAIDAVLDYQPLTEEEPVAPPDWITDLLRDMRHGRVETHPGVGLVLFARQSDRQAAEPDLFADDDDLLSATGKEVSVTVHSESVRRAVRKIASRCLDEVFLDPLEAAAYWHDAGKLDERFQVLLRQGDESAVFTGEPLAKSTAIPSSPGRRRAIREASGLPRDFRHEMLSMQLAQRHARLPALPHARDLTIHLVESHHGYGRPFAPVSPDPTPPAVRGTHGGVTIDLSAAARGALAAPHDLTSGISERYWRLTRRYGWWGLAYLEAVVRLGDWYGSQFAVPAVSAVSTENTRRPPERAPLSTSAVEPLVLAGIDGANPLGFLAALGTLTVLHAAGERRVRMAWKRSAIWQPLLTGLNEADRTTLQCDPSTGALASRQLAVARMVADALRGHHVSEEAELERKKAQQRYDAAKKAVRDQREEIKKRGLKGKERKAAIEAKMTPLEADAERFRGERQAALRKAVPRPELALGKQIECPADEYREHVVGLLDSATAGDREPLDFLAAFASDGCLHESDSKRRENILAPTPFCFITGSGHQYFLDTVRQLMGKVTLDRVHAALFEPWQYHDETLSLRWDPAEDRRYALMDRDPTAHGNKSRTVWMANLLAYRALVLFPSAPRGGHLVTAAWNESGRERTFTWPIWHPAVDLATLGSLLVLPDLATGKPDNASLRARGILAAFRARRIKVGSGANFKVNFSQISRA